MMSKKNQVINLHKTLKLTFKYIIQPFEQDLPKPHITRISRLSYPKYTEDPYYLPKRTYYKG